MEWFALYVKSRHEYVTGHELQKKEMGDLSSFNKKVETVERQENAC